MEKIYQIADNIHGLIKCSNLEKELISTPLFNRLHSVLQNSTAYKTFPSNKTTRFVHSLGAMHICGKMFYYSFLNGNSTLKKGEQNIQELFLRDSFKEISSYYKNNKKNIRKLNDKLLHKQAQNGEISELILDNFKIDEYYKSIIPHSLKSKKDIFTYIVVYQSLRCAALLHDIGHPPYSHLIEHSLSKLSIEMDDLDDTKRLGEFKKIMSEYQEKPLKKLNLHERIGALWSSRLIENIVNSRSQKSSSSVSEASTTFFYTVVQHFVEKIFNAPASSSLKAEDVYQPYYSELKDYISGHLDCDRLDYVTRDLINSGFDSGVFEYDRLLSSMKMQKQKNRGNSKFMYEYYFTFDIRCLNAVEDFFKRRWTLYKDLIYHHRVRKIDAILEKIIYDLSIEHLKSNESIESFDGNQALPLSIAGLWQAVEAFDSNEKLFISTNQWKDSWLDTTLEDYLFNKDKINKTVTQNLLAEFVQNKKMYFSLVKRNSDFELLNKSIVEQMNADKKYSKIIDELISVYSNRATLQAKNRKIFVLNEIKEKISEKSSKFFLKEIKEVFSYFSLADEYHIPSYKQFLTISIDKTLTNFKIHDSITKFNDSKNSKQMKISFHDYDKIYELKDISSVHEELKLSEKGFPDFYIFIRYDEHISSSEFLVALSENILCELYEILSTILRFESKS